jgi:hypothetical protein
MKRGLSHCLPAGRMYSGFLCKRRMSCVPYDSYGDAKALRRVLVGNIFGLLNRSVVTPQQRISSTSHHGVGTLTPHKMPVDLRCVLDLTVQVLLGCFFSKEGIGRTYAYPLWCNRANHPDHDDRGGKFSAKV